MRCTNCGTDNRPSAKFCDGCGTAVSRSSPAPVSERRWVSVLFCDLVGFTTLAESKDVEDVRELLSAYFDAARTIVSRYGGTVEKFIGDAVMAVWGVPVTNEDDAERAVRAGLDLLGAVEALGTELGVGSLAARAGIVSGEAAVNLDAVGQGMVAGDLVNTASRLQAIAAAGQVLVGESTFQAARDAVSFDDAGTFGLKGKAEPVHAWRALRLVGQRRGAGRSDGVEPPFVGRNEELRRLIELLHATGSERAARLVSVTGIAGIGKSRLAWELQKYVDGLADVVYWHQGRSPAYGEGVAFWALAEMVRMRAGIAEGEDPDSARRKLSSCVESFVQDDAERRWMEPRLCHLLALGEEPAGEHQELFSAWRTFFERIAERAPVVMIFEDLHWADSGLLDYVESVADWCKDSPIFVLTLSRPELAERRPHWGTAVGKFTSLHLDALSNAALRELVLGLVRGLPERAADRLVERAEGVPLFAVETVRALADRGILSRSADAYELCGEFADVELPGTLHSLIASRLDALGADARAVVLDASVLGKTFSVAALSAVTGKGEETLASLLQELVHREILALDADPRSPERGQYGFLQAIVREVAYATISRNDRRAKHLTAAHFFESLAEDDVAGIVANHYLEAHRTSRPGPETEVVAAKARDWLRQACARARSLGSTEAALVYAEQALDLAEPGPERAEILVLAGETAVDAAEHDRAIGYLEEAVTFYEAAADRIGSGRATAFLALSLDRLGRYTEAIARAEDAFRALEAIEPAERSVADTARAQLGWILSWCSSLSGSPASGLEWAEKSLAFADRLGDRELLARALGARATSLFDLGRHREAALLAGCELELALGAGSLRTQSVAKQHESAFVHDDDPRRALVAALEAAELAHRAGVRDLELLNKLNATEKATFAGDWATARALLDELAERRLPPRRLRVWTWFVALLDGLTADPADALERLEGNAPLEAAESVDHRSTYHKVRALASLAAFDLDRAVAEAAAAVALDPAGFNSAAALDIQAHASLWRRDVRGTRECLDGMEPFQGRWMGAVRLTTEAGMAALRGRIPEATSMYRAAAGIWRDLATPLDLALCGLDAALLLGPQDRPAGLLHESFEILRDLRASPFLALLDQRNAAAPARDDASATVPSLKV